MLKGKLTAQIAHNEPSMEKQVSYYKTILSYLLLINILIVLFSSALYSIAFYHQITRIVLDENERVQSITYSSISQILDQVHHSTAQIAFNSMTTVPQTVEHGIDYSQTAKMLTYLSEVTAANQYSDSVYVVYPDYNRVISSRGIFDYSLFHDLTWLEPAMSSDQNLLWIGTHSIIYDKMADVKSDVISLVYKLPIFSSNPDRYVVYNIKASYVNNLLHGMEGQNDQLFLLDENLNMISMGTKEASKVYCDQLIEHVSDTGVAQKNVYTELGGKRVYLSTNVLGINRWVFVSVSSMEALTSSVLFIILSITALAIVLTLLVAFFSRRFAIRIYTPVANLLSNLHESPPEADSPASVLRARQFDEFVEINQQVTFIRNRNAKLLSAYQKILPSVRDNIYIGLLYGQIRYNANIDRYAEYLGIEPNNVAQYMVVLLCIDNYNEFQEIYDSEQQLMFLMRIEEILKELANQRSFYNHVLEMPDRPIAFILGMETQSEVEADRSIFSLCNQVTEALHRNDLPSCSYYVGVSVALLDQINKSYESAEEARGYGFHNTSGQVVFHRNVRAGTTYSINHMQFQKKVVRSIKRGSEKQIASILSDLKQELRVSNCSLRYVKRVYYGIFGVVMLAIEELDEDATRSSMVLEWTNRIDTINNMMDFSEICECVSDIFLEMGQTFSDNNLGMAQEASEAILQFIEDNYHRDIGLQDISEALLFTPATINRILRQNTQKTFFDSLTAVRINKAIELLTDTSLLITEISERVGYVNVQSFIRMFKKEMGITPGDYRKKNAR